MDGFALEEKSYFKMLTFSSEIYWGSYIHSIAKTASKKIGSLIHIQAGAHSCCFELDWGCYIISIDKTASKKIGALIHIWIGAHSCCFELDWGCYTISIAKTPSNKIEFLIHIWIGPHSCCLEFLVKLQKRPRRTVGPSFVNLH